MTRDEQRQAWRVYAAALSTRQHVTMTHQCAAWADVMLEEERKRFDTPDHIADADKMVEPRPWVGLNDIEVLEITEEWTTNVQITSRDLVRIAEQRLRDKNGGTR